MGDWTILIQGHGPNQNGLPTDADEIAKKTAAELKQAGQVIRIAEFIYGRPEGLLGLK